MKSKPKVFKKKKSKINPPVIKTAKEWTVEDVLMWLEDNDFDYASDFEDNEINGEILLQLTLDNLKEIGVKALGKRLQIYNLICKLNEPEETIELPLHDKTVYEHPIEDDLPISQFSSHSSSQFDQENTFIDENDELELESVQNQVESSPIQIDYYPDVTKLDKLKHFDLKAEVKVQDVFMGIKTFKKKWCVLEKGHLYVFYNDISKFHIKLALNTKLEELGPTILKVGNEPSVVIQFDNNQQFTEWKSCILKYTIFHTDHAKSKKIEIVKTLKDALSGTNIKQTTEFDTQQSKSDDADHINDIIDSYSISSDKKYDDDFQDEIEQEFDQLKVISNKQRPYVSYINKCISPHGIIIKELKDILKDNILLLFLEQLTKTELPSHYSSSYNKDARYKLQIRQNLQILMNFMTYLKIDCNVQIDELLKGNEEEFYTLLDAIYEEYQ